MINKQAEGKIRHPEFAARLQQACDSNPSIPPHNHGRLQYITDQLAKRFGVMGNKGNPLTAESVRKWLYGETLPRKDAMRALAVLTGQDEAWLSIGTVPELPKKVALLRDARADGAVNLVAGLARMAGAAPAFPRKGDTYDEQHSVDLHLTIHGAHFFCHVANCERTGAEWRGAVPVGAVHDGIITLAVCHVEKLRYRIFRITAEDFDGMKQKGGSYEVMIPADGGPFREIETFGEML
jgi:hypothetical protein